MVDVGVVVALLLFFLLPSLLSPLPFGVIVAAVAAIAAVVAIVAVVAVITVILVSPAPVPLAAFIVAFTVIAITFLTVDVRLIFDCCVPLPPEEDHCLPPPSGKVPSCPSRSLSS